MSSYTVHQPPAKPDGTTAPERFVFVRDGFAFWAFALAPFWMLRHRLWLVLIGYVVVMAAVGFGLRAIGASDTVTAVVILLVALLVGIEAATLRRFTLARRGWSNVGLVVGDDLESVERRFYDAFVAEGAEPRRTVWPAAESRPPAAAMPLLHSGASDVIGLFPQPGAPR